MVGDAEAGGQFAVLGCAAELLDQGLLGGAHLQEQFLGLAAGPDLPAAVAEVPFDLPAEPRQGVGAQALPVAGVEVVDCL